MERLTIVNLRQRNDLGMHRHADPTKTPDLFQDIRHIGFPQQHRPQRAVGRVDGNVLRAEALLLDPLPVRLRQVGKGHKIAVQKAETIVIVLQVERTAQPFRHLGQKAERAFVVAGAQTVKERLDELDPQIVIRVFLDLVDELLITATHQQLDSLFGNSKTVIDHVTQTEITHRQHHIARLQSEFGGDAARGDGGDLAASAGYTLQIGLIFHAHSHTNTTNLVRFAPHLPISIPQRLGDRIRAGGLWVQSHDGSATTASHRSRCALPPISTNRQRLHGHTCPHCTRR